MGRLNDFIILVMLILLIMLGGVELITFIYEKSFWTGVGISTISAFGLITFIRNKRKKYKSRRQS